MIFENYMYDVVGVNWIVVIVKIAGSKTEGSLQYRGGAAELFLNNQSQLCNNSYTFV